MTEGETVKIENGEKKMDLVFEGGGVKGIGLVGALSVLEERRYKAQNVAGASAGAIVAALHAAGYSASELRGIIDNFHFTEFEDKGWEDRIPLIGKPLSLLLHRGIYEGEAFTRWMREKLADRGVRTFGDLIYDAEAEPRYRHKAQVIVSDVTERRLLVLPRDAGKIGKDPDELDVALAVRMSMSIPIFFEPVKQKNPRTSREHLIVDGGMLSNFPVWLFDSGGRPEWPTFGLKLVEDGASDAPTHGTSSPVPRAARTTFIGYLKSLVGTMMEAHDRLYIEDKDFARTIPIKTLGVRTTEFDLHKDRADALYESGCRAAEEFLDDWDFERYVRTFRTDRKLSRRQAVDALSKEVLGAGAEAGRGGEELR